jgi:hypothetical protein
LDRDENGVAGSQGVERKEIECGRAIQKDKFILASEAGQQILEAVLSLLEADQLDCGTHEVLVGGNKVQALNLGFLDDSLEGLAEDKGLVESSAGRILGKSDACGSVGLGIAIDEEGAALGGGD